MSRAWPLLLLAACAPAPVRVALEGAETIVVVRGRADGVAVEVYEAATPIELEADADTWVVARAYAEPAEALALSLGANALAPDGIALPPSTRETLVQDGGLAAAAIAERVSELRLARPPCSRWRTEPVRLHRSMAVSFAEPFAGGVLFGVKPRYDVFGVPQVLLDPPELDFLDASGVLRRLDVELRFPGFLPEEEPRQPEGSIDGARAVIVWHPLRLITLSEELAVESTVTTTASERIVPSQTALARDASGRTMLLRGLDDVVYRLDEAGARWMRAIESPTPREGFCGSLYNALLLRDRERGVVGFLGGPVGAFDLAETPAFLRDGSVLPPTRTTCDSAYLEVGSVELLLVTYPEDVEDARGVLSWRRAGGAWERVTLPDLVFGRALAASGGDVFLAGPGHVAHVELLPGRPDVAPRVCPSIPVDLDEVHRFVVQGDHVYAIGVANRFIRLVRE